MEAAFGNGTAIRLRAHAAWGIGQLEEPNAARVTVDGMPAQGRWHLDAPVHEDFHAMHNGYRTWIFEPPVERGVVGITLPAADGPAAWLVWPTEDLKLQAQCTWEAQAPTCSVAPAPVAAVPWPAVGSWGALLAAAWIWRRRPAAGRV